MARADAAALSAAILFIFAINAFSSLIWNLRRHSCSL